METILEKHENKTLSLFPEENSLVPTTQTAFRPQHITETALLTVPEELKMPLDGGWSATIILLNPSAAFDTVDHEIQRMSEAGVKDDALNWLTSFLKDRTFQVCENSYYSDILPLGMWGTAGLKLTLFRSNVESACTRCSARHAFMALWISVEFQHTYHVFIRCLVSLSK